MGMIPKIYFFSLLVISLHFQTDFKLAPHLQQRAKMIPSYDHAGLLRFQNKVPLIVKTEAM